MRRQEKFIELQSRTMAEMRETIAELNKVAEDYQKTRESRAAEIQRRLASPSGTVH
jgi:hypothetical protein